MSKEQPTQPPIRTHRKDPPCAWIHVYEGTCECGVGCAPIPRPNPKPLTAEESRVARAFARRGEQSFHWRMRSIAELRAAGMHAEAAIEERAMRRGE